MSQIAILGANGQLGSELMQQLGDRAVAVSREQLDLLQPQAISVWLDRSRPAVVINCAAYTAVDQAEEDCEACLQINGRSVEVLAQNCAERAVPLIQISTDYVFDSYSGDTPRTESAEVDPRGVYAYAKRVGELAALSVPRNLVVRTCGLYGGGPIHRNFVETMLRLAETRDELNVVNDQHCTPSYGRDVAAAIIRLIETGATGLYHVTNSGSTTWHEFATTIFEHSGHSIRVMPISTQAYGAPAPRPCYSVLDNAKLVQQIGQPLPPWQDALTRYLRDRQEML